MYYIVAYFEILWSSYLLSFLKFIIQLLVHTEWLDLSLYMNTEVVFWT
jgi:hypothetical protein